MISSSDLVFDPSWPIIIPTQILTKQITYWPSFCPKMTNLLSQRNTFCFYNLNQGFIRTNIQKKIYKHLKTMASMSTQNDRKTLQQTKYIQRSEWFSLSTWYSNKLKSLPSSLISLIGLSFHELMCPHSTAVNILDT